MIFGNISYSDVYCKMSVHIQKFVEYINKTDLTGFSKGIYEIEGKDFFVNIVEYNLKNEEDGFWEAHREYLDIHFIIDGSERIKLNFIDNLQINNYEKESDFVSFKNGDSNFYVDLKNGDFLICFPHDAHMTALKIKEDDYVKKAIFKIKL